MREQQQPGLLKSKKDAAKRDAREKEKAEKAMEAEKRRSNFFQPRGSNKSGTLGTEAASNAPTAADKGGANEQGKADAEAATKAACDSQEKRESQNSICSSAASNAAAAATTFNNRSTRTFQPKDLLANFDEDDDAVDIDDEDGNWRVF